MALAHPDETSLAIELIPSIISALDGDDPEACLTAAVQVLRSQGLAESPDPTAAWLTLQEGERSLVLAARRDVEAPDLATRTQLRQLLRACLRRINENTDRRRARERMEMLSAASFEGIMFHVDGNIIDANQRFCDMIGYEPEEVLSPDQMMRCVAPEDYEQARARIRNREEGEFLVNLIRKDGKRFVAEFCTKQTRLGDRPVRVVAIRDVSARERTAKLLRESEARLRQILEVAFDCVVLSRDGQIIECSAGAEALFECPREQLLGSPALDFVAPGLREEVSQRIEQQFVGAYETSIRTARGALVPVSVVSVHSTLDGVAVRAAGLRDLRAARRVEMERRRLEIQVERSQRLESLGVLAGGIAHDFNNLLVAILGGAELLLASLTDPAQRANAEGIRLAGEQAASLTKQMLAYAGRRELGAFRAVDVAALLQELGHMLDAALSKKARVAFDLAPGCRVLGERATLSQVLMNLLTNASDALEGRPGAISVTTRRIQRPDARWDDALGATVRPGDWVLVEVRDTGSGMSEATRQRIFEPFFTTKARGHGLGLGACLSIVAAHGGAILVESALGQGSTFSILLPAADGDTPLRAGPPKAQARPCHVLLVDDEPLVRGHMRRLLELRGFAVSEATSGESGLRAITHAPPDLVLLDLTMPDLDGIEVVRKLRGSGSQVPVVLCSGNTQASAEHLEPGMVQAMLDKPFSIEELVDAIGRARR